MHSPLENPVWQALVSRQQHLNAGGDIIKFFPSDISPFAGLEYWDRRDLIALEELLPAGRSFSIMLSKEVSIPASFDIIFSCMLYQMVCEKPLAPLTSDTSIIVLDATQVPSMLELTALTKPGPFFENTIAFGTYYGIFEKGKLAAMAGERLKLNGYTEVSAICTHPSAAGKGYASKLTTHVARQIQEEGNTPFLHVKQDNKRAIEVYKRIGFDVVSDVYFAVFRKKA